MQLLINGLIAGSLAALIAGGLALVFGVLRIYNLALGQTVLVGGYATWWFHRSLEWPLSASIALGIAAGVLVSWVTFDLFMRPFYRYHPRLPLVTTIALGMILDGMILLLFEEQPRSILSGSKTMLTFGSVQIQTEQII